MTDKQEVKRMKCACSELPCSDGGECVPTVLASAYDTLSASLARVEGERDALRTLADRYVPRFDQPRYFNTDGQRPHERSSGEVRARFDELCEGAHFTVVKPDSDIGFTIHVGGIQPREHVLDLLRDQLDREWADRAAIDQAIRGEAK